MYGNEQVDDIEDGEDLDEILSVIIPNEDQVDFVFGHDLQCIHEIQRNIDNHNLGRVIRNLGIGFEEAPNLRVQRQ